MDFDWVSVERRFDGEKIRTDSIEGWAFHELARVKTASPTHADALRLLAVFLAHWDNKSENQRLVCLSGPPGKDGLCKTPMAMLQDVGATFGPRKVNLAAWRTATIWTDRARCEIGMPDLPHGGATFVPVQVSEAGRRFLADRLSAFSADQVSSLFRGARSRRDRRRSRVRGAGATRRPHRAVPARSISPARVLPRATHT